MSTKAKSSVPIEAAAKKLLGFESLRPGQREAIQSLLEKRDTVLVQPTGSGKSAVYQIAGSMLPGPTVVISPLIALQKDQAESIEESDLEEGVVVNSALTVGEQNETLDRIEEGKAGFIFMAPEQFRKPETVERLRATGISLFAIDEAHCISQWGHDFRPDYLELAHVIEALDHPTVLAMTATASKEVREEIVEKLGMRNPLVLVHELDRPNISLRVDLFSEQDEKYEAVLKRVEFAEKPGIVYVATHKHAEVLASELKQRGVDATVYHGGMRAKLRDEIQDRFMSGAAPVIVATNAFGMGVDKPDIRFVYHADISESLDAYYQEIGRAGRDGKLADAVLFYRPGDVSGQRYKTGTGNVVSADLNALTRTMESYPDGVSREELSHTTSFSDRKILNLLHKLEAVGITEQLASGQVKMIRRLPPEEVLDAVRKHQSFFKEVRVKRLQQLEQYAETRGCRREYLLRYFGDNYTGPCGNCDRCEASGAVAAAD